MASQKELCPGDGVIREAEQTEDMLWAFTKMVDICKYFRAYCYHSVVEQGFSRNEIDVLISLKQYPEKNTVKGISETVHLSKGMISQAVESLRKKQMVTVNQDERDRRLVLIHLSTVAQPVLEKLKESYAGFMRRIAHGISWEQLREAAGVLTRFYENKEEMRSPAREGSFDFEEEAPIGRESEL